MAVVGELVVAVLGNTAGLSAALAKSEAELKGFSAAATSHGNVASNALGAVGMAGAAVAVGVTAYLAEASHSAIGFQDALAQVAVTAHLTNEAVDSIGSAIETASIGTTVSSVTMVRALIPVAGELERITGGALTATDAVNVLTAAESLHASTGTALDAALKAIADTLLTYHLRTSDAAGVATLLFAAHAQLGLSTETVANALQKLQPRIAGSGISLLEMLAITREMEPVVGTGQRAILKLGSILQDFLSPSKGAQETLAALHVTLRDSEGRFIGFGPALDRISGALSLVHSPAQRAADLVELFGKNANIASVLLAGGSVGLEANKNALNNQGTAAEGAAQRNLDLHQRFLIATATIATITDAIGGALIPALTSAANVILPVINTIGQWVTLNPQLASQILVVAGAVGAMAYALTNIGPGILLLLGPLGLVIGLAAAVGLAAAHFGLFGEGAKAMSDKVIVTLTTLAGQIAAWIGAQLPVWAAQLGQWASAFVGWITPMIPTALAALGNFISQAVAWIGSQLPVWGAALYALGTKLFDWVAPQIPRLLGALGAWSASVVNWVLDHIPDIAAALFRLADQFVGWLVPRIPAILQGLAQFGLAIASWIIGEIPHVIVALGRLGLAFIGWIVPKIPGLLLELAKLGLALVGWVITQGIPLAAGALVRLGASFLKWIGDLIPQIPVEMGKWANALLNFLLGVPALLAAAVINIGSSIISGIIKGIGEVGGAIHAWLFGTPMPPPPTVTPSAVQGAANIAHGQLVAGSPAIVTAVRTGTGGVQQFQHGGVVSGLGPQLAIVHGGETVLPPGGGGQVIQLTHTSQLVVGGDVLAEIIERRLFRNATNFSSGFGAANPVTGA